MANTVTQRTLSGASNERNIVRLITIVSDGSEESDLVIFSNAAFINSSGRGKLMQVWASGSSCQLQLEWDQTTDSPIAVLDPATAGYLDFRSFGGISNPNGTGATGDVLLTTTNLDSGDVVTLIIHIDQSL